MSLANLSVDHRPVFRNTRWKKSFGDRPCLGPQVRVEECGDTSAVPDRLGVPPTFCLTTETDTVSEMYSVYVFLNTERLTKLKKLNGAE